MKKYTVKTAAALFFLSQSIAMAAETMPVSPETQATAIAQLETLENSKIDHNAMELIAYQNKKDDNSYRVNLYFGNSRILSRQLSDHMPFRAIIDVSRLQDLSLFTWNILGAGNYHGYMDNPHLCNRLDGKNYGDFTSGRSNNNISLGGPLSSYSQDRLLEVKKILQSNITNSDIVCLQEVSHNVKIDGQETIGNSFYEAIQQSTTYASFYKACYADDWQNSWTEGKKIDMDFGVAVFVNDTAFKIEEPNHSNSFFQPNDRLNRSILLKLTNKDNQHFYFLGVHLAWINLDKGDTFGSLAQEIKTLQSKLDAPLIISGDFNCNIENLSLKNALTKAVENGSVVARPQQPHQMEFQTNDGIIIAMSNHY